MARSRISRSLERSTHLGQFNQEQYPQIGHIDADTESIMRFVIRAWNRHEGCPSPSQSIAALHRIYHAVIVRHGLVFKRLSLFINIKLPTIPGTRQRLQLQTASCTLRQRPPSRLPDRESPDLATNCMHLEHHGSDTVQCLQAGHLESIWLCGSAVPALTMKRLERLSPSIASHHNDKVGHKVGTSRVSRARCRQRAPFNWYPYTLDLIRRWALRNKVARIE